MQFSESLASRHHDRVLTNVCRHSGDFEPEGGAGAGRAFHLDAAAVLLQNAVADGEAEPGAFVLAGLGVGLGGEEGVEDAVQVVGFNAAAGVRNLDDDLAVGW